MASLTEQLQEDTKNGMKDAAKTGKKTVQAIGKGIGLIFNATVLSEDAIMHALDKKVEKTGDTSFSYVNVTMEELQKSGKVERIDEPFLKEVMQYFDKYCREDGVKYSALKMTQDTEKNAEDKFIIFFEGKNDKVIEHIIKQAIADWQKAQQNTKENGKEKNTDAKKGETKERQSVLAKLAFFRNRVKESVEPEKNTQKANHDKIRQPDLGR